MKKIFSVIVLSMLIAFDCMIGFAEIDKTAVVEEQERYNMLCSDDVYDYSMDRMTAHRIKHPYLKEDLLDVWIKMTKGDATAYTYPEIYTLKHYYVRLSKPELQLLQVIRVKGDEINDIIVKRPYREKNWEAMIPGGAEEELYQALLKIQSKISRAE